MFGYLKNRKIKAKKYIKYLDDEDIFIFIDGVEEDGLNLENIEELYTTMGEEFVYKIHGFFSIYLYDKNKEILIIIRDKMGTKPVYYCKNDNGLLFGNDIMEIVKEGNIIKEINIQSLSMYFRYEYISPPETIFKNIYKLGHGQYLKYEKGKIAVKTYWDVIDKFNTNSKEKKNDFDICKKNIKDNVNSFVKNIIKKEKNIGIYLSSGIDSSLVTALSVRNSNKKINTFSIGFTENEQNEAKRAKEIASYLGTNHHELYLNKNDIIETIKKIPDYYKEPFSDGSIVPTIILNEFAKKNNIKVAMTGDGADQLFCGAELYDKILACQRAYKILNPLNICMNNKYIKKSKLVMIYANNNKQYQAQSEIIWNERLLENIFIDNGCKRFEQENRINSKNWQEKRMILDFDTFIAEKINNKMGRAANYNGIEVRSPFLKDEIIEMTFKIPHKYKYHNRIKKYILKQVLYDYIPEKFFDNKKRGFGIPKKEWIKNYLLEDLNVFSTKEFIKKQNIFNYEKICKLIKRIDEDKYTNILWNYFIFQMWYEKYMV